MLKKSTEHKPIIIFIGEPVAVVWVIVAHVKYTFEDICSSFKCAIAAFFALNIKYPTNSERPWLFLQKYLFNISTPYNKHVEDSIKTLANDLIWLHILKPFSLEQWILFVSIVTKIWVGQIYYTFAKRKNNKIHML